MHLPNRWPWRHCEANTSLAKGQKKKKKWHKASSFSLTGVCCCTGCHRHIEIECGRFLCPLPYKELANALDPRAVSSSQRIGGETGGTMREEALSCEHVKHWLLSYVYASHGEVTRRWVLLLRINIDKGGHRVAEADGLTDRRVYTHDESKDKH